MIGSAQGYRVPLPVLWAGYVRLGSLSQNVREPSCFFWPMGPLSVLGVRCIEAHTQIEFKMGQGPGRLEEKLDDWVRDTGDK